MNKLGKFLLVLLLFMMYTMKGVEAAPPQTSAQSAVLMDAGSGRVLWSRQMEDKRPMASTTKIMTALVALENGRLEDTVTVDPSASGIEGSSIWLSPGEKHTLEDLLYGLMLRSGNDAATAIAQYVGGSVQDFAQMMNASAVRIGAVNSNFVNPHGLPADNHFTTAYDLALITSYALGNPDFERIVSTKYKTIPWEGHDWDRAMKNKNKLLWQYEGANGVKTGYTKEAGRCLVASAKRNGLQLVAVVLNCGPMFEDCMALMDYGFEEFENCEVLSEGDLLARVPVVEGRQDEVSLLVQTGFSMALRPEEKKDIKFKIDKPTRLSAPVQGGQICGTVSVYFEDRLYREIPLVAAQTVEKLTFWNHLKKIFEGWIK